MKIYLAGLILFSSFYFSRTQAQSLILCFDEKCEISISGESNVSPYQCQLSETPANDTIDVYSYTKNGLFYLQNAIVKLPAKAFQCDNRVMTNDFLKSIKAEEFPEVSVDFRYFKLLKPLIDMPEQRNVPVKFYVTIAGVKKGIYAPYKLVRLDENILTVKGTVAIKMSDFNITPPQALFGAIKVQDEIQMVFNVRFCVSN